MNSLRSDFCESKWKFLKISREEPQGIFYAGREKRWNWRKRIVQLEGQVMGKYSVIDHTTTQTLTYRFYIQLGPSLCTFQLLQQMVIFNKVVVCPTSLPSPGFNHWGLLWCFWGMTHPLWVWLRSGPGHCVVEIQRPLHCLFWKSGFLAPCEGQCRGEPLNERTTWEIYSWFGHILDTLSIERAGESLVCPVLGLPDELCWI